MNNVAIALLLIFAVSFFLSFSLVQENDWFLHKDSRSLSLEYSPLGIHSTFSAMCTACGNAFALKEGFNVVPICNNRIELSCDDLRISAEAPTFVSFSDLRAVSSRSNDGIHVNGSFVSPVQGKVLLSFSLDGKNREVVYEAKQGGNSFSELFLADDSAHEIRVRGNDRYAQALTLSIPSRQSVLPFLTLVALVAALSASLLSNPKNKMEFAIEFASFALLFIALAIHAQSWLLS